MSSRSTRQSLWPIAAGLTYFVCEGAQQVLLIPFYAYVLGDKIAAAWVSITVAAALLPISLLWVYQPLIRNIAIATGVGRSEVNRRNWSDVSTRALWISAAILLVLEMAFASVYFAIDAHDFNEYFVPCAIFFLSLHVRQLAWIRFILHNGIGRVGVDKAILAVGSVLTSVSLIIVGGVFPTVFSFAIVHLLSAALVLGIACRYTSGLAFSTKAATSFALPKVRESTVLGATGLGGFMLLWTDVLMASAFLDATDAITYAFWSRLVSAQNPIVLL
jgi:hypothetical protein